MIIYVLRSADIESIFLPKVISGQYVIHGKSVGGYDKALFAVTAANNKWILHPNQECIRSAISSSEIELSGDMLLNFKTVENESLQLLVQNDFIGLAKFDYYSMPMNRKILAGNSNEAEICFNSSVGPDALLSLMWNGQYYYVNLMCNPSDGKYVRSYIDNNLISNATIAPVGSVVFVLGAKIILGNGFIAVNRTSPVFHVNLEHLVRPKFIPIAEEDRLQMLRDDKAIFSSAPRNCLFNERKTIDVESPPQPDKGNQTPYIIMLGPALTISAGSLFSSVLTIQNLINNGSSPAAALPSLVMSLTMVAGMTIWPLLGRRIQDRQRRENNAVADADYRAYLKWLHAEIQRIAEEQKRIADMNNPSLAECLTMIYSTSASLWQRSRREPDFLDIMIGHGVLPLDVEFKYQKRGYSSQISDPAKEMYSLMEKKYMVSDFPVTMPLRQAGVCGVIGIRGNVLCFCKALIVELTALYDYDDLRLSVIYDPKEEELWRFVKWIPHVNDPEASFRSIASTAEEVKNLTDYLQRRGRKSERDQHAGPHYIVIAADRNLTEQSSFIKSLYEGDKVDNITVLALYDRRRFLPKECRYVVELNGDNTAFFRDYQNVNTQALVCTDYVSLREDPSDAFIRMANIYTGAADSSQSMPVRYTFMEMCNAGRAEHIDLLANWKKADPVSSLRAQIGIDSNGSPIWLDIHEKAHGPHGLIAGMTGSGKSEFIISYIVSLAITYSPEDVAFILIDFKGGGMADVFRNLPHTTGLITNLDGNELKRSFMAIESELRKRQRFFKEISERKKISNIDIYRYQNLRRQDHSLKPLPHLILISDEFAELKQQHRDFMEQLVRIARIGRSLGVHLILATQKPDGVVDDQIKSNIRFRICLKVQDASDSKTMIGRPDASLITNPGRFYLVVGNDEIFEYGQSPWSGATYEPSDVVKKDIGNEITILDHQGMPILREHVASAPREADIPEKQIDALVDYISSAAVQVGQRAEKLWLPPLEGPKQIQQEIKVKDTEVKKFVLDPVVGLYDDLENQRHIPLSVPFSEGGNTALYGTAGSGVLEFIQTMLVRLLRNHSPEELQLYILDYDAGSLSAFVNAPHTAEFMSGTDMGNPGLILSRIQQELQHRRLALKEYGGDYQNYIHNSGRIMPNVLLVINNFQSLMDAGNDVRTQVTTICREGTKFGVFVFLSGSTGNSVPYSMHPLFYNVFTLQQNNEDQYREIVGKTGGISPAPFKGRGLVRLDGSVYEFQTDMVFPESDNVYNSISDFCLELREQYGFSGEVEKPIEFHWQDLEERKIPVYPWQMPVGIVPERNEIRNVNLYDSSRYLLIHGPDHASQYRAFMHLMRGMGNCTYLGTEPSRMKLHGWDAVKPSEFGAEIQALWNEMLRRADEGGKAKKENREIPDFEHLVYLIDGVTDVMEWMDEMTRTQLVSLICGLTPAYHIHFVISESEDKASRMMGPVYLKKAVPFDDGLVMTEDETAQTLFSLKEGTDLILPEDIRHSVLVEAGKREELIALCEEEEG